MFYHKVPALSSLKIKSSNCSGSNGCILICDCLHGWAGQDSCYHSMRLQESPKAVEVRSNCK